MPSSPTEKTEPWTIQRLLNWTKGHLAAKGVGEPRLATEVLLAQALGCRRIDLYARFDRVPEPGQLDVFRDLVKRAAGHTPISYLVGRKEFYSLEFEVSPAVLIPRPETELLVQQAIETVRGWDRPDCHLLDLCTGSGCIAIALLKNLPTVRALATDVSADALAIAARNAAAHGVDERLTLVEADRLVLPGDAVPAQGFDLIACNPPYVAVGEMATLDANVRDHEPHLALTDGSDGLSFYRLLAEESAALLQPEGALLLEVADGGAEAVREIFAAHPTWRHTGTWRDAVAGHERVLRYALVGAPG
ncbi:MAG TPA: peptide chain release factor N(5)-glutamine methyltransferase [Phycisphaerae bacterium]|nr:peptide chain release factor N(5)-glutamine methyltransferase [Phycisphaerae bacterium]